MVKSVIISFLIVVLSVHMTGFQSYSQSSSDSALYNKGLQLIKAAGSVEDYSNAGDYFARLTVEKPSEWLAPLYAALSYALASFNGTETNFKDELCDTAQVYLNTAISRDADPSEAAALQAYIYQARIDVSPFERGPEYSVMADNEIKKAEADNSEDPRPYFLHAMNVYYKPKIFGGGPSKALPLFEQAAEKFRTFKPETDYMPHWGERQNLEMLEKCKKEVQE